HGARSRSGTGSFDNDRGGGTDNNGLSSWINLGDQTTRRSSDASCCVNIIRAGTLDTLVVPFILRLTMESRDTLGVARVSLTTTITELEAEAALEALTTTEEELATTAGEAELESLFVIVAVEEVEVEVEVVLVVGVELAVFEVKVDVEVELVVFEVDAEVVEVVVTTLEVLPKTWSALVPGTHWKNQSFIDEQ
ncbi:hypothetical protein WICPIJ_007756, partial [Wickerhamomyces pijperi]